MEFDVIIIGGGIAGCHVAIELAKMGKKVALVEKNPHIGGLVNQIGLVYPTNDCASCMSPTAFHYDGGGFRKCFFSMNLEQFGNIQLFTLADLTNLKRENSHFSASWVQKPRYVSQDCDCCGLCELVCPYETEDEFNCSLISRRLIYLPHLNAVPHTYVVDREKCETCEGVCVSSCPRHAINLSEDPTTTEVTARSLVIATGLREWNPSPLEQMAYGRYENVITQLELARFLDPNGPTGGLVLNPVNDYPVNEVLIGLCSGSRDERYFDYCSGICCTYGLKHALYLRERGINVTICYMDLRLEGQNWIYYEQAKERDVNFVRGQIAFIERDPGTLELNVQLEDTLKAELIDLKEDVVVLTPALIPCERSDWFSQSLGLTHSRTGFFDHEGYSRKPFETEVPGLFVVGSAQAPMGLTKVSIQVDAVTLGILKFLEDS